MSDAWKTVGVKAVPVHIDGSPKPYVTPPEDQVPPEVRAGMEQHWSKKMVEAAIKQDVVGQVIEVFSAYCMALELTQKTLSHAEGCAAHMCWCGLRDAQSAIKIVHAKLDALEKRKRGL